MIIWIASYPKSGNTWVRSFLSAYFMTDDGDFKIGNLDYIQDYPNQHFFDKKIIEKGEVYKYWEKSQKKNFEKNKVKFLKTHNALISIKNHEFTYPKYVLGIIHVVRDPRNIITSLKNHLAFTTYDECLKFMKNDKAYAFEKQNNSYAKFNYLSSWKSHYKSWINNNQYKLLTVRYEDLESDTYNTFRDMVVFINTICKFNKRVDNRKIIKAIESTSFEKMKKFEENGSFKENKYKKNSKEKIKFFYLGNKNNWKNLLNNEIKDNMNKYYKEDLIKFEYEKD
ncbi:sulfotransferase domain-containing protein [Pelagibacterales bacterium SAG-MED20]|nr:sulfotransferase domain-containing protein [Pelagibacterales bacterium SAG-MED20]